MGSTPTPKTPQKKVVPDIPQSQQHTKPRADRKQLQSRASSSHQPSIHLTNPTGSKHVECSAVRRGEDMGIYSQTDITSSTFTMPTCELQTFTLTGDDKLGNDLIELNEFKQRRNPRSLQKMCSSALGRFIMPSVQIGSSYIRPAVVDDLQQLERVWKYCFGYKGSWPARKKGRSTGQSDLTRSLLQKIEAPQNFLLMTSLHPKDHDIITGLIDFSLAADNLVLEHLPCDTTGYAYASCLAVWPAYKRQGIATSLVAAVEQLAVCCHQEVLLLHVDEGNEAAQKLYHKLGYRVLFREAWWLRVVGQVPRMLLYKNLERDERIASHIDEWIDIYY